MPVTASSALTRDAYAIFLKARTAVTAAQYPGVLNYTIAVSGDNGNTQRVNHYSASCAPIDGTILVNPISTEQAAQPPKPHGANLWLDFQIAWNPGPGGGHVGTLSTPAGRPEDSGDVIGVPILSPTYMFGMRYRSDSHPNPSARQTPFPVIAVVSAERPDYAISLWGTATVDGVGTYHLGLTPLREPKANRLRELWVGKSDYLPRKAVVAGNFTIAPLVDVPWTIDFSVLHGAPFIQDEHANQTLFLPHRRVVRNATITFENVRDGSESTPFDSALVQPPDTQTSLVEPGSQR
jgi:hypothetical protein